MSHVTCRNVHGHKTNASLRAHKSTVLAGVGFESYVGCFGLAPPGVNSCVLSRPNHQALQSEMPALFPHIHYTISLDEMSIRESLI
jgi:hypothetical protein